jgi:hypothetical protein
MTSSLNLWLIVAVSFCAFVIGLSKGGLGGAAATLITPTLALVMSAQEAVGIALPMLIIGDWFALWAHWRGWDRRVVFRLLPGSIVGIIVGSVLLGSLPPLTIRHGIGLFALAFCIYKVVAPHLRQELTHTEARPWYAPLFGGAAGVASALANAGGPIADAYVLTQQLPPMTFIATEVLYFTVINALKIPFYLSTGALRPASFLQIAWAIPLVPLGVVAGKHLIQRVDMRVFEWIILGLLVVAAGVLLTR